VPTAGWKNGARRSDPQPHVSGASTAQHCDHSSAPSPHFARKTKQNIFCSFFVDRLCEEERWLEVDQAEA
jgi:hypothetical protein